MTVPEAAAAIGYSRQTIARIEAGSQPSRTQQIKALCETYGAPVEQQSYLTALAVKSNERGWWEANKAGVIPEFRLYAEAEQEAVEMLIYEPEFVPGIAQADSYIRALLAADPPRTPEIGDAIRAFRLQRQELLYARSPLPRITMLLGAGTWAYLRHAPSAVQVEQAKRLMEVTSLPGIEVLLTTQPHPAMGSGFTVLTPPDDDGPAFAYMDAIDGCRYVEDPDVVSHYRRAFSRAREVASPIEEHL
ncbi:helix-turn-helix protein [Stackebrandtia albiflava]|uniref:Helix-turn-helix protein n=2 Tax=Stackebrandtia albiflava TaxID=406432 RepID=A0A562VC25_9ACTN|nr:helix-turn-helix protein [Stackebrandtia albiflava]